MPCDVFNDQDGTTDSDKPGADLPDDATARHHALSLVATIMLGRERINGERPTPLVTPYKISTIGPNDL